MFPSLLAMFPRRFAAVKLVQITSTLASAQNPIIGIKEWGHDIRIC